MNICTAVAVYIEAYTKFKPPPSLMSCSEHVTNEGNYFLCPIQSVLDLIILPGIPSLPSISPSHLYSPILPPLPPLSLLSLLFPFSPLLLPCPFPLLLTPCPFPLLPLPFRSRPPYCGYGVWGALKLPQRVRAEPGRQTLCGAFSAF